MKFLCVECDQPMKLAETRGPDRGSMSVLFECESCGKQTAMLTNSMETQMVSSLGVSIGGRDSEPEPMEMLRSSLISDQSHESDDSSSGSKCPFTGVVNEAMSQSESEDLRWTDDAAARMERIPSFVRPMVQKGIEDHARAKGLDVIDASVLETVRKDMGM